MTTAYIWTHIKVSFMTSDSENIEQSNKIWVRAVNICKKDSDNRVSKINAHEEINLQIKRKRGKQKQKKAIDFAF